MYKMVAAVPGEPRKVASLLWGREVSMEECLDVARESMEFLQSNAGKG